jgi:CRP-like cAMP-binding protein
LELPHPLDLLLRKLDGGRMLDLADRQAVLDLPMTVRSVPAATYLTREGEPPGSCAVIIEGYAFRHKITGNGARQIVSLHIPGEALDFQGLTLAHADHNIQTLTRAELAVVPMSAIRELTLTRPAVGRAIVTQMLVEASIFREWIVNVGRRSARERLAHLLCEFACRLDAQGLADGGGYELPMTQEQIGDALGLTSVHVNRSIKALSEEGLLTRKGRVISFPDIRRLREVGDFSELYLHLQPPI